jgi:WD40 repeat protein/serine/threonine protein kinase/tetratricopeptide (TPR) repeat protein
MAAQGNLKERLFSAAAELIDPGQRAAFLDAACGNDPSLRAAIEDLLRHDDAAGDFLSSPAVAPDATSGATEPPPLEPLLARIGPYKLIEEIGDGGMGTVYMAQQTEPVKRLVALKIIKPGMDSRQVIARFEAERQALALMDHPNIARVFDAGTTETGRPYFVMELVKGVPLTKYCDEHRLTPKDRLKLFIPVCQAIQHAHQKGIIHRDIKPSNVLVALYDGEPVPKVIDFGIAKAAGQQLTEKTLITGFGAVVGTLEYMSPEQAELNQLDIDTRSDIYSLGVLLYELLTGTTPMDRKRLQAAAMLEMLRVIREDEPPKPSTRLSTMENTATVAANRGLDARKLSGVVRGELDWIVMKALEKDRKRRYETASGLAADLRRYLDHEAVLAGPPSSWYRLRKLARRNRAALATMGVVAAALVAVALISVIYATEQVRTTEEIRSLATALGQKSESLSAALAASKRVLAIRHFDRGQAAFEKGEIGPGLLWMIESWRSAIAAGDPAWQHAARANLAAWQAYHPRLRVVLSHPAPVDAAAFSPDGRLVLTGGDDFKARLWDATSGAAVGPVLEHPGTVHAVAFSPDGKTLLTGCADSTARLWETATARPIGSPIRNQGKVMAVAFSPDGKTFLTGCTDGTARLWDATTGLPICPPLVHKNPVMSAAFRPDGKSLVIGCYDGTVSLWSSTTGQPIARHFLHHQGSVESMAFAPDGKTLLTGTGGGDQRARLWDAVTGQPIGPPMDGHRGKVRAVAFNPDGKTLLTGSDDKTARLWDAASNQPIGLTLAHQGPVVAAAFSPDGKSLLTVSSDSTVRLWDASPGQPSGLILEKQDAGQSAAFAPDGKSILSATWEGEVTLWGASTGLAIWPKIHQPGEVTTVAFRPDGETLLTSGNAGQQWDAATGHAVGQTLRHRGPVNLVAYSPDGKLIMTGGGGEDHTVRLWDAATGTPLGNPHPVPGGVDAADFSPDGRSLLTGYETGTAQLWDIASWTSHNRPFLHPGAVSAAAFSSDGKTVLTGCEDGAARLWDVATGVLCVPPLQHQAWVFAVAFSPDGKTVLTGSRDKMARLWDTATGQPIGPGRLHPAQIWTVAFGPDGKSILTGCNDYAVRLFRTEPEPPDEFERIATWAEVITGLTLDAKQGAIQVLGNAAWRERRQRLEQLGGEPEPPSDRRLDPIPFGTDPKARGVALMARKQWDAAEAAFSEVVRARPYNASSWLARGQFYLNRGQQEKAGADFTAALQRNPENAGIHYLVAVSKLLAGDLVGYRGECAAMMKHFETSDQSFAANRVAYACIYAPDAVVDMSSLIRIAEKSLMGQAGSERIVGAVLYRAGRCNEALKHFGQSHKTFKPRAWDWLFLAMIHGRLGHPDQARRMLSLANQWIAVADAIEKGNSGDKQSGWTNDDEKSMILLLRKEAESLVMNDSGLPADPFAR